MMKQLTVMNMGMCMRMPFSRVSKMAGAQRFSSVHPETRR